MTPWAIHIYSPWNSPGQNTGVDSLSLLQGVFPTQRSNPGKSPKPPSFLRLNSSPLNYIYHVLFIHSSFSGQLNCLYLLPVMNNAAINMDVKTSVWSPCFQFLSRSGISGPYDNFVSRPIFLASLNFLSQPKHTHHLSFLQEAAVRK